MLKTILGKIRWVIQVIKHFGSFKYKFTVWSVVFKDLKLMSYRLLDTNFQRIMLIKRVKLSFFQTQSSVIKFVDHSIIFFSKPFLSFMEVFPILKGSVFGLTVTLYIKKPYLIH